MLNWVPFGSARWVVADSHGESMPVAEFFLNITLPYRRPVSIAASAISKDQNSFCLFVILSTDQTPPLFDRVDCKLRSLAAGSYNHQRFVLSRIVNPVRDSLAFCVAWKIVVENLLRFLSPSGAIVLKIAYLLFLLGINADGRRPLALEFCAKSRYLFKLRISSFPITRFATAGRFNILATCFHREAHFYEESRYSLWSDVDSSFSQLNGYFFSRLSAPF